MATIRRWLTAGAGSERGSVLVLTCVASLVMLGFLGLGLDLGAMFNHRRLLQTAADAGAMHGGSEIYRGKTMLVASSARKGTEENGFKDGADNVVVEVFHPPATGYYVGDSRFVEVRVQQPSPTFFMRLFGFNSVQIPARAVAGAGATAQNCIYVLEDADPDAFWYNSSARLTANCGLMVNSRHSAAVHETSNANVTVASASITGNYWLESSSQLNVTGGGGPRTGVPPAVDPLSYLTKPTVGACDWVNRTIDTKTPLTINPGVYCGGLRLKNDSVVTMSPGTYIMVGGNGGASIATEGKSVLKGTGVTIFLTEQRPSRPYQPLSFQSSSGMDLKAPTTGPYAGILFYQDPAIVGEDHINKFESNSTHVIEGALYFPTTILRVESSTVFSSAAKYTAIVAREFVGDSNSVVNINADYSGLPLGSPLKRLTLVE